MFEELNVKTLNHKFKIVRDGDGWSNEYTSKPATKKEIDEMRKDSKKGEWMVIGCSCWECNGAHIHMIDRPNLNCFLCGRLYHKGYDITDYTGTKYKKHSHLTKKNEK